MVQEKLPYITIYPPSHVIKDIKSTGDELYENLVNAWITTLEHYRTIVKTSPPLRQFLESYLSEQAKAIHNLSIPDIRDHIRFLPEIDQKLRAEVFALFQTHPENDPSQLPFLEFISYPALYNFIRVYGLTNVSSTQSAISTLYSIRGGKPFCNSLMATVLGDKLTDLDSTIIPSVILMSSPLLAKDWITPKWFFALENVFVESHSRSVVECAAASFLLPLSILDSNTKMKVISDIINKITTGTGSQYHLLSTLLNYTNFSQLIGVPSLVVSLETARLRIPKVDYFDSNSGPKKSSSSDNGKKQNKNIQQDPESIASVRDLFPQLSEQTVSKLLSDNNGSVEETTSYLLDHMDELDRLAAQLDADLEISSKPSNEKKSKGKSNKNSKNSKFASAATPTFDASSSSNNTKSSSPANKLNSAPVPKQNIIFGKKKFDLNNAEKESLEVTLQRIYNADEDEYDDTYDDSEAVNPSKTTPSLADDQGNTIDDAVAYSLINKNKKKSNSKAIETEELEAEKEYSINDDTSTNPSSEPQAPKESPLDKIEKYLWEHYERGPEAFTVAARRTRVRTEMRKYTNWSHEQIEGWARMLERSPRRKKILEEKYMFRGNAITIPSTSFRQNNRRNQNNDDDEEDGESSSNNNRPNNQRRHNNNNNSNRNNKNNNKGDPDDKHSRQRKEQNKAKHGNHNRKAGHDRKMQRMG